jgi:hypothetical protein
MIKIDKNEKATRKMPSGGEKTGEIAGLNDVLRPSRWLRPCDVPRGKRT